MRRRGGEGRGRGRGRGIAHHTVKDMMPWLDAVGIAPNKTDTLKQCHSATEGSDCGGPIEPQSGYTWGIPAKARVSSVVY